MGDDPGPAFLLSAVPRWKSEESGWKQVDAFHRWDGVDADTASLGENAFLLAASVAPHHGFGSRLMNNPVVHGAWRSGSGDCIINSRTV